MTSKKNLGSVASEVPGIAAVLSIEALKREIKRFTVTAQRQVTFANTAALCEINKIVVSTDGGSYSLSGPAITLPESGSPKTSFGPWLMNLLSRATESYWSTPNRVLYSNLRIEPGEKIRIEIFTNGKDILGNRNSQPEDPHKGDIIYVVKAELEDIVDDMITDFCASTTQKEFEASEINDSSEKFIPIKTDNKMVQYIGVFVEKSVVTSAPEDPIVYGPWTALDENTDNFGSFIVTAGGVEILNEDYLSLRTWSNSDLKIPTPLPAGVFIHRILPTNFPYGEIFNPNFGIAANDIKISVKGLRNNTTKYRFTVSTVAYSQVMKVPMEE